ncbi:nuclear receptor coactivator 5-like [Chironomus tepperi]|uniref:nuclear receptor coactivator 5-like n=1 Tax=Chironomus tepperi TaxID=113505 RepID=UPI00391F3ADC
MIMESVNLRDPTKIANRIYVGHINEGITSELLDIKFAVYGKIVGILRTSPTFAFIQFDQSSSAQAAIENENGSFMGNQKIMVKAAEMKSQKHKLPMNDIKDIPDDEPMNKKYFSDANEYYGNNSIMAPTMDSDINHCEIIVLSRSLRPYAEEVEKQLKMLGMHVDLMFPNDQIPMNKVLGNIQSRGCLYGILITPINAERKSLTLTILYGDATEHRNMPTDDAIRFIYKDFVNKTKGISPNRSYQHPEAISTLLKNLFENRSLTVLQYEHIIKYLSQRKEAQVIAEIGEDAHESNNMDTTPAANTTNTATTSAASSSTTFTSFAQDRASELQKKILGMLKNKTITEKIAQNVEKKTKLTQSDKDDLKQKVLKDEKVKSALSALLGRK